MAMTIVMKLLFTVLAITILISSSIQAEPLEQQRLLFLSAEKTIKKGYITKYKQSRGKIKDYILFPYLEYDYLAYRIHLTQPANIKNFIEKYQDSPLASKLQYKWLKALARHKLWDPLIQHYQTSSDTKLDCQYRAALLRTGQIKKALHNIESIWLVGKSQPDACTPLFDASKKEGIITQDLILQRAGLAMKKGQLRLARYLARSLNKEQRSTIKLWLRTHQKPHIVTQKKYFKDSNPLHHDILAYGMRRLAFRDLEEATNAWPGLDAHFNFPPKHSAKINNTLGILLAQRKESAALGWLSSITPTQETSRSREWRVRSTLQSENWSLTLNAIKRLTADEQQQHRWRYWRARALEALGFSAEANQLYVDLAASRNYHGFLAADRLGLPYSLQNRPLSFDNKKLKELERIPAIARAKELFALNRIFDARREWFFARQSMDKPQAALAAELALEWGWYSQAIFTAAQAKYWDNVPLRFPLDYRKTIENQANHYDIEPAWVYGILRQESAFIVNARSHKGALGLMQLLPSTGKYIAKRVKKNLNNKYDLFVADKNIELGSAYLRYVKNRLYDNPVLATAAYNAGVTRVRRWLPDGLTMSTDAWIETIPYDETRHYLESVMAYTAIYNWRLNENTDLKLQDFMPAVISKKNFLVKELRMK